MDKKGIFGSIEVFGLILLILVLAVFGATLLGLSSFNAATEQIITSQEANNVEITLLNLLRTPVETDLNGDGTNEKTTLSQLIIYAETNSEAENLLKNVIDEKLETLFGEWWSLQITYPSKTKKFSAQIADEREVQTTLPSASGENIHISLAFNSENYDPYPDDYVLYEIA